MMRVMGMILNKGAFMEQDSILVFMAMGAVVIILIIALVAPKVRWKASRWEELAKLFTASDRPPQSKLYRQCMGNAGRASFAKRTRWAFRIGFSPGGITIRVNSKKYQDLLVPWDKVRSASKYSLGSRTTARVDIESGDIRLNFYLAGEALTIFESWHRVDAQSLQQFTDTKI